jgi:hypothetical protein
MNGYERVSLNIRRHPLPLKSKHLHLRAVNLDGTEDKAKDIVTQSVYICKNTSKGGRYVE